ncbi:MAG TPA: ABC transporter ATP-binding protein [Acidimicrobiia bacterium]
MTAAPPAPAPPQIKAKRYFRDQSRKVFALGFVSLVSGYFQAAAFLFIVPLATAISSNEHHFRRKLGPVHISASTVTLAALAAGAIISAAFLDAWIAWYRAKMVAVWELRCREALISEYLDADYPIQAAERLGTLSTLLGYATGGSTALGAIVTGLEAALTIAVFVSFSIVIDYRAALILLLTLVVLSVLLRPFMGRTRAFSRQLSQMNVDYGREVTETTRMARDVRVFHANEQIRERMTEISLRIAKVRQKAAFVSSTTAPAYQYIGLLMIVASLGVAQSIHGLDFAKFGVIALLLLRSMTFGQQLQAARQLFVSSMPYIDQLEEQRSVYRSNAVHDGTVTLEGVDHLDVEAVSYSYDGDADALSGVTVSFEVGEVVGIVGPSGSGKSTLSQLILRLREPTSGRILVNGTAATDYTLASWYRHVSLVPQDPRLFHATVSENIAFLDPTITQEMVVAAARAANVHDVIESLEHGYDTLIGPAFRDLSGGQIQRIGIARALARQAKVLVLDEPTSALDVHSEAIIQSTLEAMRGQATVLIIAHRLSTLSICDRILVLRDGKVETLGTLADVSERSDFFRRAIDAGTLEVGVAEQSTTVPLDDA